MNNNLEASRTTSTERTVAFVDLAGFTALTDAHGDAAALELVDAFTEAARDAVTGIDAELVKAVGDAVMIAAAKPQAGLRAVQRIFKSTYALEGFPEARAGLHGGPVIERGGDYYGATVNLAARIAGRAGSGATLATSTILDAATALGITATALGPHALRNVARPVELWSLDVSGLRLNNAIDPVCRMRISVEGAAGTIRHDGVDHWFCSLRCIGAFVAEPERYVGRSS